MGIRDFGQRLKVLNGLVGRIFLQFSVLCVSEWRVLLVNMVMENGVLSLVAIRKNQVPTYFLKYVFPFEDHRGRRGLVRKLFFGKSILKLRNALFLVLVFSYFS